MGASAQTVDSKNEEPALGKSEKQRRSYSANGCVRQLRSLDMAGIGKEPGTVLVIETLPRHN